MVKKVPKLALWQNILWRNVIRNYDYEVQTSYTLFWFFIFLLLCLHYVTDLIKKLELRLLVTFIFNKE